MPGSVFPWECDASSIARCGRSLRRKAPRRVSKRPAAAGVAASTAAGGHETHPYVPPAAHLIRTLLWGWRGLAVAAGGAEAAEDGFGPDG